MTASHAPGKALNIRELARAQQLDGSWNNDLEMTAAALLAFVRQGQTTQKGYYRKQLQRAFAWLAQTSGIGFAGFLRALALQELAEATQKPEHQAAFEQTLAALPAPADDLQSAALQTLNGAPGTFTAPTTVQSLDELRLAVLTRASGIKTAPELLDGILGRALAAGLAG
jgi:hypothetical protein